MKRIDDIKDSLRRSKNITYVLDSICKLAEIYKNVDDSALLEYVPVKIVSCFEEHFRQIYKEILDRPEFKKNIKKIKYLKDLRFDLDFLDDMLSNDVTLADYLSYNFPCSSLEQVFEQLGILLNIDFKKCLIDKIVEVEGKADIPEKKARENVYYYIESVGMIFHTRHIICHEGLSNSKFDNKFIMQMISDAQLFLEFVDKLLFDIIYSGVNITQTEMNTESAKSAEDAEEELQALIEYIQNNLTDPQPDFEYINAWKEYRRQRAESESSSYKDASIFSTIYSMSLEATTRQMISQLRKEYRLYKWEWKSK
jgi:hypothetical protein